MKKYNDNSQQSSVSHVTNQQLSTHSGSMRVAPASDTVGELQQLADRSPIVSKQKETQVLADQFTLQRKEKYEQVNVPNLPAHSGPSQQLPTTLKTGIESLSGINMDDVTVHYNSDKPAQLKAHAYAQGNSIHLASGQERHLPHEAWHVVQQKQNRVRSTTQLKGVQINDDSHLEKEADIMGEKAMNVSVAFSGAAEAGDDSPSISDASPVQRVILKDDDKPYSLKELQVLIKDFDGAVQEIILELHKEDGGGFSLEQAIDIAKTSFVEDSAFDNLDEQSVSEIIRMHSDDFEMDEEESFEEAEDPFMKATLEELSKVNVDVPVYHSRIGETVSVNLAEYYNNPRDKKFKKLTLHGILEQINLEHTLAFTSDKPDADRITALHWIKEELDFEPKKSSGGGGGNLAVTFDDSSSTVTASGRPGFEKHAIGLPGMKKGFHRRHIVAWHTLKSALQNVINHLIKLQGKDAGIAQSTAILLKISDKIGPDPEPDKPIISKKKKEKVKPVLPKAASANPDDLVVLLSRVLSKINSNILNLWPGDGYENSLINTYQGLFRSWSLEVAKLDNTAAGKWLEAKVIEMGERVSSKKGRYASVLNEFLKLLSEWKPEKQDIPLGTQISNFLNNCADNFEVDFPFSPDRESFQSGQVIATGIVGMAGALLDWSEGGDAAFKNKKALDVGLELDEFLNEFLFPTGGSKVGNSGKEKGSDSSKKDSSSSVIKKKEDVEQVEQDSFVRKALSGFVSVPQSGNTCYIASVMNTILTISQYRSLFLNNPREETYNQLIFNVINHGRNLLNAMQVGRGTQQLVLSFRAALINAGWLGGNVDLSASQQDSSELLTFLLDLLGNDGRINREHRWQDRGVMGMHTEHATDNILTLSGLSYGGSTRSLNDLLAHDLDRNRMESEQVNPQTIREHNWRFEGVLPNVLTIQLARFRYSTILQQIFKLKEKLAVPLVLTVPQGLTQNGVAVNYRLSSFIVHQGNTAQSGHYYSYQRRGNRWYLVNDANVHEVTDQEVLAKATEAYMVVYEKV